MKLPLLLNYKPRLGVGPTVMLAQGSWKIESNHVDSIIMIALGHQEDLFPISLAIDSALELDKDTSIKLAVNKIGTESELTIFMVRQ